MMDELHFTGNCLKGSRPVLSFDATFDTEPHLVVMKELFMHIFGVPKGARKSKPFVDHVMGFTVAGGRIWIRCYQISETEGEKQKPIPNIDVPLNEGQKKGKNTETSLKLIEIGPRFVLTPIVILESSFGGPVLYENKEFVSPNQIRAELRKSKAGRFNKRAEAQLQSKVKRGDMGLTTHGGRKIPKDPLDNQLLFA